MAARAATKSIRHLLSISDLSAKEFKTLVDNGIQHQQHFKNRTHPSSFSRALAGQTIGITFSKRSTRTRISTEGAIVAMGGHPIFLGSQDIQLGVNETLRDTSQVMSSMVAGIVARVGPHSDVQELAKYSSVPVINALSDKFHPTQAIADLMTIREVLPVGQGGKIAWVGDSNNVLFDLATGCALSGIDVAVAAPEGYGIPQEMRDIIQNAAKAAGTTFNLTETTVPEEAIKDADVLVTDTWISMGQESEKATRLKAFAGYQITESLAKKGGAKKDWKFMHCLPRHEYEVDDEVFYSPQRSLVFPEAENRLYSAMSVIDTFIVNKGEFRDNASRGEKGRMSST